MERIGSAPDISACAPLREDGALRVVGGVADNPDVTDVSMHPAGRKCRRGRRRTAASRWSLCRRIDGRVVLQRSRRLTQVERWRQEDLIDREAIFPGLNAQRVRAAVLKVDRRAVPPDAPAVVLPSPARQAASTAVFKVVL